MYTIIKKGCDNMRRLRESFDPKLYAKRSEIKRFTNDAVQHFVENHIIPTIEQVEDYVTSDRWAKANIYDGEFGIAKNGFEFISLNDLCKNIQNLCSFNLDDMYESYPKRLRIKE